MKRATNWYTRYLGWFWKHKVISVIIILVVIVIASTSGSKPKNTASNTTTLAQNNTSSSSSNSSQAAKPATRQVKGTAVTLGAGTFTGGKDVVDGLYDVTPGVGQSGNFVVTGTDEYNEILGNAGAAGGVDKVRVQISSGDSIQISGLSSVTFTPVTAAFVTGHAATNLYAGTFIVGQDVGAGRYTVTPGAGQSGNFIVTGADEYDEILGGDSSMGGVPNVSVSLTNGDKVTISGMSQVKFTPSN